MNKGTTVNYRNRTLDRIHKQDLSEIVTYIFIYKREKNLNKDNIIHS